MERKATRQNRVFGRWGRENRIFYEYDDQGYRTQKTTETQLLGGFWWSTVVVDYVLSGDKVLYETNGTYGMVFNYDYDGTLIGFTLDTALSDGFTGSDYFYLRNQQGDITMILDVSGTVLVKYRYDAYGNCTVVQDDSPGDILSLRNPYTYRGYRYDSGTGLYYLNSRYYNPQTGRFLNADGMLGETGDILSTNMYAYCANNPVMHVDPNGQAWWHWGVAVVAVAILATLTIISCGGFAVGLSAIILAGNGIALVGLSSAATVLAFATAGATLALTGSAIYAGLSSSSGDEFAEYGSFALLSTTVGGVIGALAGYAVYQAGLNTFGTYSTPQEGRPNSTYTQLDQKGNTVSETYYNNYGQQGYRIDYSNHFIKGYGNANPHIHVYQYDFVNEILRRNYNEVFPFK